MFHRPEPKVTFGLMVRALLADMLRNQARDYVMANLGSEQAALVTDDTRSIKKGARSVGLVPRHGGLANQAEDGPIMSVLTSGLPLACGPGMERRLLGGYVATRPQ